MGISQDLLRQLEHVLRPLRLRIANMIVRGVVHLPDDAKKLQKLQVGGLAGETIDGAEHFQPYGFSSVPLAGAEHVTIFPNGDRSHPITIATSDRRYRPTGGEAGEVTVYNHTGAKSTFTKDGDIIATPAAGRKVIIKDSGDAGALPTKVDMQYLRDLISGLPGGGAALTAMDALVAAGTPPTATDPDQWPACTKVLESE